PPVFPTQPPKLPDTLPAPSPQIPLLPPVPAPKDKGASTAELHVVLNEIRLVGNTVYTATQLAEVTQPYLGRALSADDVETLRLALTTYYVERGYINSGAVIPDQDLGSQVLKIEIVEGRLSDVNVAGAERLHPEYVRDRLLRNAGAPMNLAELQQRLQLLQQDPLIARINAELTPGLLRGQSDLAVTVNEAPYLHARLELNNFQSPSVGAEQGLVTLENLNLTGIGDALSFQYGGSRGVHPIVNLRYSAPVNASDTTLFANYGESAFAVQDSQFKPLGIKNEVTTAGVGLRHPLYRTLSSEVAVSFALDYQDSRSFLLALPFDFVAGATGGVTRITALRATQEFTHRSSEQIVAGLSRFSIGVGAFGATGTSNDPEASDGRFLSWLGVAQWVRRLQPSRAQMVARATLQLAANHLFPSEQIAVGGRSSVRGYREFSVVRDNAFLASLEYRIPVYAGADGADRLHVAPFIDFGRSWNTTVANGEHGKLTSAGLGLLWAITDTSRFEVYWGQQLERLRGGSGNLQDQGVHVQLVVQAF
ncbi:MAG: BamA/TamA family outer membrane protein, partial [Burkholderiaceae bacterium]|nr:BamA/TamA family outer membrane protein [Burkholderiaceae bacterium]